MSEVKVRRFYGSTGTLVLAESVTIYFTGRGSFYYFNDSAFGTQGRIACSILTLDIGCKGNSTVYCWKYYSYSVYSVVYQTDFQGFKKDETLSGTCYEIGRQGNEKK